MSEIFDQSRVSGSKHSPDFNSEFPLDPPMAYSLPATEIEIISEIKLYSN